MRQFGEVCVAVVFKKTPIEAVILLMLLLVALSIRRNVVKFTYVHVFYLPFILLSVIAITLVAMKNVDVLNLLPSPEITPPFQAFPKERLRLPPFIRAHLS